MKQAIGYIRVSTEKQANEGVSLEAQEAKIVTWCKANGYELVKVYVDAGISGKRMDTRKELLAALASLKKGMALVSYSLSRLARSTKDALAIGEQISKNMKTYHTRFEALVAAWRKKGLDHNSGLQGRFRDRAHELEDLADNFKVGSLYLQL